MYLRIAGFVAIGDLAGSGVHRLVADGCQGAAAEHVVVDLAAAHLNEGVAKDTSCGQRIMGITTCVEASTAAIDVGAVDESATAVIINRVLGRDQLRAYEAVPFDIHLSIVPHVTVLTAAEDRAGDVGCAFNAHDSVLGVSQLKES